MRYYTDNLNRDIDRWLNDQAKAELENEYEEEIDYEYLYEKIFE